MHHQNDTHSLEELRHTDTTTPAGVTIKSHNGINTISIPIRAFGTDSTKYAYAFRSVRYHFNGIVATFFKVEIYTLTPCGVGVFLYLTFLKFYVMAVEKNNAQEQGVKVAPYGWLKAKAVYMNSLEQIVEDTLEVPLLSRESTISRVENTLRNWAEYRGFKTSMIVVDFEGSKFKFKELRTKWKMISTRISYTSLKEMEDGEELKDKVKNLKSELLSTKMNIGYMPEACIEKLPSIKTQVQEVEDIVAKLLGDESFRTKLATTIKEGN